jgi:fucose 4-O-acetylase-like acetyltransferase
MPLFFSISGYLFNEEKLSKGFIIKNMKRIFIPFSICLLVGFLIEFLKRMLLSRDQLELFQLIDAFLYMDFPSLQNTYGFVLWFLPALFFSKLFLKALFIINNNLLKIFISILLFVIGMKIQLPFSIDEGLTVLPFLLFGFYLKTLNQKHLAIISLLILSLTLLTYNSPPTLNLSSKEFENIYLNFLWSLSIISILFFTFKNIRKFTLLNFFGINSMLIFLLHPYTNNISFLILEYFDINIFYLNFILSLFLISIVTISFRKLIKTKYV